MRGLWKFAVALVALSAASFGAPAETDAFANWPAGRSPQEVGKRLAEHFLVTPHKYGGGFYSEVATWYGALTFAQLTGDTALREKLIRRLDPMLPGGPEAGQVSQERHVDHEIFGIVPMEIAIQTKDAKLLDIGKVYADRQWENPQPDGLSAETRFWIDDMYMLTILQLEAHRATGDKTYLDRAAREMAAYLDKLQRPNGLFYHAPDVPVFWGRGDGWVAAGMTEMLRDLPAKHPLRKPILASYRKMMATLLSTQAPGGMWRQLIDHPESWEESSSSAMFTYAFVSGVKNGWLAEETYGPAARKAWIALVGHLTPEGDLREVCVGTGKKNDLQYYLDRPRSVGDGHGQAPMLWSATALLR